MRKNIKVWPVGMVQIFFGPPRDLSWTVDTPALNHKNTFFRKKAEFFYISQKVFPKDKFFLSINAFNSKRMLSLLRLQLLDP